MNPQSLASNQQLQELPLSLWIVHRNMLRPCVFVARDYKVVREVVDEPAPIVTEGELWIPAPTSDPEPLEKCTDLAYASQGEVQDALLHHTKWSNFGHLRLCSEGKGSRDGHP